MLLNELFDRFIKERVYLKNVTEKTIYFHRQGWRSFRQFISVEAVEQLNKSVLADYVIAVRETGIRPVSINTYIRSLNAFFVWLHENEYKSERLKIKPLITESEVIKTLSSDQLRALMNFKPQSMAERRIFALVMMIIDTGIRIEEALNLSPQDIDLDNLFIKVFGKGRKERLVPISLELRKVLIRYQNRRAVEDVDASYFFCTRTGRKLLYDNVRRDYENMCGKVGIEKLGSFHRLRHTFATNYVRNGGNVLYLSKALGHTTLQMTKRYVTVELEALRETHIKTSILSRL